MEQIIAMLEAMEKDAAFSDEMMALMKDGNAGEIIGLAEKKGFIFTEADYQEYMDFQKTQPANAKSRELSPEELEQISGGGCGQKDCHFHSLSFESQYKYGANRRECNQRCHAPKSPYGPHDQCGCFGTDNCVERWHKC